MLAAEANRANPFSSPEWLEFAAEHGLVKPARLLSVMRGRQPLAFMPLQKRSLWTWELSTPMSKEYPPLLIHPAAEEQVWSALTDWLLGQAEIRRLILGPCGDAGRLEHFQQVCTARGAVPRLQPAADYVWIPLAATWEGHLAGLHKDMRNKFRRADNSFHELEGGMQIAWQTEPAECAQVLDELIRLHRERWDDSMGKSVFSHPSCTTFYRRFVNWAAEQGYVMMPIMRLGTTTLAAGSVFHVPGETTAYFHFIVRDLDALPRHWLNIPGFVLLGHVIQWAIARGVKRLGMGAVANDYKMDMGGQVEERFELSVARSTFDDLAITRMDRGLHILTRLPEPPDKKTAELLQAIFPLRHPNMYGPDRY
jgi:CelD/BcsL family acetyltransferase involved in cellulose biosynthesis